MQIFDLQKLAKQNLLLLLLLLFIKENRKVTV